MHICNYFLCYQCSCTTFYFIHSCLSLPLFLFSSPPPFFDIERYLHLNNNTYTPKCKKHSILDYQM